MLRPSGFLLTPLLLLGACTLGPDYAGPPPVLSSPPDGAGGFVRADDTTDMDRPELADWWTALGDPVLDGLEQRALAGNPDIAAARARLDQARATLRLERANSAPDVSAMAVAAHIRIPDLGGTEDEGEGGDTPPADDQSGGTTSTNFYNLGLNANWEIDLFGGQRRTAEAARAELGVAEAEVADAQVSLTAALAQAYVEYRDRQQRIALAETAVNQRDALLDFENQRFERGVGNLTEVEQARSTAEQAKQELVSLQAEAAGFADAVAILAGQQPGAADAILADPFELPLPPANVAVGDPAALLQRRPDIRVAERRLAAENARIGAAEAARFPRLTFLGILGIGGTSPSDLTHLDDFTAIAAPMLQWNFLDFGRGAARVGQAEAKRDEAGATYRSTVLDALREVEDALANFRAARAAAASQARAEASAAKMEELALQRYDLGAAAKTHLIDAQLTHDAAREALSRAKAQLSIRFVDLQKALGLGWSERADQSASL